HLDPAAATGLALWAIGADPCPPPLLDEPAYTHLDRVFIETHVTYDVGLRINGTWHFAGDTAPPGGFHGPRRVGRDRLTDVEQIRFYSATPTPHGGTSQELLVIPQRKTGESVFRAVDRRLNTEDTGPTSPRRRSPLLAWKDTTVTSGPMPGTSRVSHPGGRTAVQPWTRPDRHTPVHQIVWEVFDVDDLGVVRVCATLWDGYSTHPDTIDER
uniref:hypothetical protein n=1 Tax=Dietzia sp. SYD-A1 TaxID=2780141 RepID=UPI0018914955